MDDKIKVHVKIYGSEYTIAGDMPEEHIRNVAEYVDSKMREIGRELGSASANTLAVLAAINAADEYLRSAANMEQLQKAKQELEDNTAHYVKLWEEAKKSLLQYKAEVESNAGQQEAVKEALAQKEEQCGELEKRIADLEHKRAGIEKKNQDLMSRLNAQEESREANSTVVKELELKCKELESVYFDLQMENIQLKGEIDRYKKIVD